MVSVSPDNQRPPQDRSFSIAFINCNGLNHKLRRPETSDDHMRRFIPKHDFVGLNEAKIRLKTPGENLKKTKKFEPNDPVDGYTLFYKAKEMDDKPKEQDENPTGKKRRTVASGGVGLLVRNGLVKYCRPVREQQKDSVWCFVDKRAYGFEFVLGVHYVHKTFWSYRGRSWANVRSQKRILRQNKLRKNLYPHTLCQKGDNIIVMGDLNNSFATNLSENCILPLKILNQQEKFAAKGGRYTCHQRAGGEGTVIDYALASPDVMQFIEDFEVLPFTPWLSDVHSALVISLSGRDPTTQCSKDEKAMSDFQKYLVGVEQDLRRYCNKLNPVSFAPPVQSCIDRILHYFGKLRREQLKWKAKNSLHDDIARKGTAKHNI